MLDPDALYELDPVQPQPGELERPVLVHALSGFVDAGAAGRLAAEHLLATLPHRVLVRFDVDQLYDYRARRPVMTFVEDHWESYDAPRLELSLVEDSAGTGFLMLTGPEPDVQWERFALAVRRLVERYDVRLSVGVHAIPMAVPHTRPIGVTAHGSPPSLVAGSEPWVSRVQVPGHMAGLLEFRLGEAGYDAAGFAVHVPHYLAQAEYPDAASTLVESIAAISDLKLPVGDLRAAGEQVRAVVASQVAEQPEVADVVRALEEQYDAFVAARGRSLLAQDSPLPTAEELGAELERFLAQENDRRGRGEP
ncbi:MAG TPA: PAC2 family protein [Kineosporiaceae bacterium]|nr:PAC2 family protein [Kineosporiaceae bacterium]